MLLAHSDSLPIGSGRICYRIGYSVWIDGLSLPYKTGGEIETIHLHVALRERYDMLPSSVICYCMCLLPCPGFFDSRKEG